MSRPTCRMRLAVMIGVWVCYAAVAFGAGPYDIHRSEFADTVRSQPVHAISQTTTFDDGVGVLFDGVDYFYFASSADGTPVELILSKEESLATVRIDITEQLTGLEQAVVLLQALSDPGGTLDQLIDGLNLFTDPGAASVSAARLQIGTAMLSLGSPFTQDDAAALDLFLKGAVQSLVQAQADPGAVDPDGIAAAIEEVLDSARLVAEHYLAAARASCGPCSAGEPLQVCSAEAARTAGDVERQSPDRDPELVVTYYAAAVSDALAAADSCS